MGIGRWLPPGLLVVLFVGVAGVDLYRAAQAPVADGPQVLPLAAARFEPDDYVLDFRAQPPRSVASLEAAARMTLEDGWGRVVQGGRWTAVARASLVVQLPVGGQQVVFVDCRTDHRRAPPPRLVLRINGIRAAPAALQRGFAVYRCGLAEGALVAGDNRIELTLLAADEGDLVASGRTLLLRRLAVAGAPGAEFADLVRGRRVWVDGNSGRMVITAPGRLVMPFQVPRAGSFLTLRYRFQKPVVGARCTAVLGRCYSRPDAVDVMAEKTLLPGRDGGGALRLSLGHHTGASVLWVRADRATAAARLVLQQPVLASSPS